MKQKYKYNIDYNFKKKLEDFELLKKKQLGNKSLKKEKAENGQSYQIWMIIF